MLNRIQTNASVVLDGDSGDVIVLVRWNADGSLDQTFGAGGVVPTDLPFTTGETVHAVAIDRFERILVTGHLCCVDGRSLVFLSRYLANGARDTGFGVAGNGFAFADYAGFSSRNEGRALAIDNFDRIVVAGLALNGGNEMAGVARFTRTGRLDLTFADGRLVAVGGSLRIALAEEPPFQGFFSLAAFGANGTADPGFGAGGSRLTPWFSGGGASANDAALDAAGLVVAAGSATDPATSTEYFALARYADGTLDPAFGNGGQVLTSFGSATQRAIGIAIDTQGRIVAAGHAEP